MHYNFGSQYHCDIIWYISPLWYDVRCYGAMIWYHHCNMICDTTVIWYVTQLWYDVRHHCGAQQHCDMIWSHALPLCGARNSHKQSAVYVADRNTCTCMLVVLNVLTFDIRCQTCPYQTCSFKRHYQISSGDGSRSSLQPSWSPLIFSYSIGWGVLRYPVPK